MYMVRLRTLYLWLLLIASFISSCSPKSTPPGANSIGGSIDGANYTYHYWQEGLALLIWHDFSYGAESCSGTGSTEDPVYRLECTVQAQDGRQFGWQIHTRDGVKAEMWIDGRSYDLAQGAMFLVSSGEGETTVVQLQRDLSALNPDVESIAALASSDPDVVDFVDEVNTP
jgi:hypothetical protein